MTLTLSENYNPVYTQEQITDVDIHAHVLPFLDNGPDSFEEALLLCDKLVNLHFKQCIVTPRIMHHFYENTEETIIKITQELTNRLYEANIPLKLRPAAEYYVDQDFLAKLKTNKPLLTLDDKYNHLLIETAFLNEFDFLLFTIERLKTYGYIPVMAHPEKFNYLFEEDKKIRLLKRMGLKLQVNMGSFLINVCKSTKSNLKYLYDNYLIDFVGSNIHDLDSANDLGFLKENSNLEKILKVGIKNQNLRF
jgi:tyrosine-protein phosphatase YwqE